MTIPTPANPASATRDVAKRIAEALEWKHPYGGTGRTPEFSRYCAPDWTNGVNQMHVYPLSIHLYSPGESCRNFGFRLDFHTGTIQSHPTWRERERWTPEGHAFMRKVDAITDGLVSWGLHNAGETDLLRWLTTTPTPAPDEAGGGTEE